VNKQQFLEKLAVLLKGLPEQDVKEILYDYDEHFRNGAQEGKTEEEIASKLGDVRQIANQFRASYALKIAEEKSTPVNVFRAVAMTVTLGFFNLVIVFGPYIAILGVLAGMFAAALGITVAGVVGIAAAIFSPLFWEYISLGTSRAFVFFLSVGTACLGVLIFIADFYIAKYFFKGTVRYLKWNFNIIKG